jgi:hypothetical protein
LQVLRSGSIERLHSNGLEITSREGLHWRKPGAVNATRE